MQDHRFANHLTSEEAVFSWDELEMPRCSNCEIVES